MVPQPPYSTDLSSCDFFLFPRLKNRLKRRHFGTLDNIQRSVTDELKGIPAEAFQHCYEQWKQRLRRCVAAQGNYFEGDNLSGVPRGDLGCSNPPPRNSEGPPKLCETQPDLRKLLKIAEFRTPTPQDVRKKGSKIRKPPRFAIFLY